MDFTSLIKLNYIILKTGHWSLATGHCKAINYQQNLAKIALMS